MVDVTKMLRLLPRFRAPGVERSAAATAVVVVKISAALCTTAFRTDLRSRLVATRDTTQTDSKASIMRVTGTVAAVVVAVVVTVTEATLDIAVVMVVAHMVPALMAFNILALLLPVLSTQLFRLPRASTLLGAGVAVDGVAVVEVVGVEVEEVLLSSSSSSSSNNRGT